MEGLDLTISNPKQASFATYLNMAQGNAYIALRDIVDRLNLGEKMKEARYYFNEEGKKVKDDFQAESCHKAVLLSGEFLKKLLAKDPAKAETLKTKLLRTFPFLVPMLSMSDFYGFTKDGKMYYTANLAEDNGADVHVLALEDELLKKNSVINVAEKLRQVLSVLNFYRDNASHSNKLAESKLDAIGPDSNKVAISLDGVFIKALGVIKKRFKLKGNEKNGRNLQFVQDARVAKIDPKNSKSKRGPNYNWPHCFYFKNNGFYTMSKMAVVFLACQFIEKTFATQFFDQIKDTFYMNISKEDYRMWLREIYSCYHIRLPKRNINPYDKKVILGLDMLNEISKCPKDLFDCLKPEDQDIFRVKVDGLRNTGNLLGDFFTEEHKAEFEKMKGTGDASQVEVDNTNPDAETILLKRATDRFPVLAMRWLDKEGLLGSMRFQVLYGKYHGMMKDKETGEPVIKHCCDEEDRPRWISKDLLTFGKLDEVEKLRNGKDTAWDGHNIIQKFEMGPHDEMDFNPWITDIYPQYVMEKGQVGIKDLKDSKVELPSILGKELSQIKNDCPDYWLSLYDLPAMVFYAYLKRDPQAIVNVIKGYRRRYEAFFDAFIARDAKLQSDSFSNIDDYKKHIEKEFKIKWKDIPTKLQDVLYPLGKRGKQNDGKPYPDHRKTKIKSATDVIENEEQTTFDLKAELEEYNDVKNIDAKDPKFNKFLPGNLAKYLVKDIVKYQKFTNCKDKPSGMNYNALQAKLATFASEEDFNNLVKIFGRLNMLKGNEAEHPFLDEIINAEGEKPQNVIQFYYRYLNAKKNYLLDMEKFVNSPSKSSGNIDSMIEAIMAKAGDLSKTKLKEILTKDEFLIYDLVKKGKKDDIFKKKDLVAKYATDYFSELCFVHPDKDKWKPDYDLAKVAESYKKSIPLPSGIFVDEIRKILEGKYPKIKEMLADKEYITCSYLLECYIKEKGDEVQCFYGFPRTYPVFTKMDKTNTKLGLITVVKYRTKDELHKLVKVLKERIKNRDFDDDKAKELRKLYNEYQITERAITRTSVQDFLLFEISKEIIIGNLKAGKSDIDIDSYKLKKINPGSKDGLLATEIDLPLLVEDFNKAKKTINWHFVISDYARIFTLLNDRRLKKMLALINDNEFTAEQIQFELAEYDRNRVKAFDAILNLEKKAYSVEYISQKMEGRISDEGHAKFSDLTEVMSEYFTEKKKIADVSSFGFAKLDAMRNNFAHGDYPFSSEFDKVSIVDCKIGLSANMLKMVEDLCKAIEIQL